MSIKRIILHWTGGADGVNDKERDSYNAIITRNGEIVPGRFPPEAQTPENIKRGSKYYAAHTLNMNSYSMGIAVDAMAGAIEHPFTAGKYPITEVQLDALAKYTAQMVVKYGLVVTRQTVLTHAEVQRTLGVTQRNKWDITWLPKMLRPADPIEVGDMIRDMVKRHLNADGMLSIQKPTSLTMPRPILKRGAHGASVEYLQEALERHGNSPGDIDGLFGSRTDIAVRRFQLSNGLYVDGIVGPQTWKKLDEERE